MPWTDPCLKERGLKVMESGRAGARWQSLTGCLLVDEMRQSHLLLAVV